MTAEIRRLMDERGWSGRELARRAGLVASVVAYKVGGERPFDVDDLSAVAAAFEMKVADLIARAEG